MNGPLTCQQIYFPFKIILNVVEEGKSRRTLFIKHSPVAQSQIIFIRGYQKGLVIEFIDSSCF